MITAGILDILTNKLNNSLSNLYNDDKIQQLEYDAGRNYGYTNTASGPVSDFRHQAAMNELSKSLGPNALSNVSFIPSGDTLAFGAGLINEIPALFRGLGSLSEYKKNLGEIGEDLVSNFKGTYLTSNKETPESIYEKIFSNNMVSDTVRAQPQYETPQEKANNNFLKTLSDLVFTPASAAERMPIEDLRTMPLGTQETFGEKLQPTIPTGGSIFTDRFENFNQRVGETGIQQVVSPYEYTFNPDVLKEEEDAQYNLPEKSGIFSNILNAGLTYATGLPFVGKGLEYLGNQFSNTPQYQRYTPGYNYGNLNPNLIDDFYDPATGLNRFDRAKTLFGQSRTLSEYLSKKREKAEEEAARRSTSGTFLTGGGGDTFSFSDNSGYGGTGTSSPSNVGPGGTLGGGV